MGFLGIGNDNDQPEENDLIHGAPRKGFMRFVQLILRDLWEYMKANVLCCLCFLPAVIAGTAVLLLTRNYALCSLAALVFSVPAGGGLCGLHRVLNRSVRDMLGKAGPTFKKGFMDNLLAAILPGMLAVSQILLCFYMLLFREAISAFPMPTRLWTLLVIVLIMLHTVLQYCFPLLVVVDLRFKDLLKNCFLLFLAAPKQSLLSFLITAASLAVGILFCPMDIPFLFLLGAALGGLVQQLFTWAVIDKHLHIGERQNNVGIEF